VPDTTTGTEGPGEQGRPARAAGSPLRWVAVVLAVVLVAASVLAALMWTKVRGADDETEQRAEASAVASQFALRMDKVDGSDFAGYIKSVNQLLTTKAKTKNNQQLDLLKQTYEAAKIKGTGKVLLTGVGDSDSDSATVLVVHDADVTTTQGDLKHHYRWQVDLVKVGSRWLVDDFNPVN
jgi:Mce-associated membrane protein